MATSLPGAMLIDAERIEDDRGFFARSWCRHEFEAQGLNPALVQCNISYNRVRGTVRGMHFQATPHAEAKVVRCTAGAIYDVIVDLRPDSPTFCRWMGAELTAQNRRMLYIPEGFAHGFQSLADETEVLYQMSTPYASAFVRGVRWDDPAFEIAWRLPISRISARDRSYPDFRP